MSLYIRAIVTEEEKQVFNEARQKLGMSESELIRAGLRKMGIKEFAPLRQGRPTKFDPSSETIAAVRADYENRMKWQDIQKKYGLKVNQLQKILGKSIRARSKTNN